MVKQLDLCDLRSVRACSADILQSERAPDILMLNAGIMAVQKLERTADGFESQIASNHIGHFLLAAPIVKAMIKQVCSVVVIEKWRKAHATACLGHRVYAAGTQGHYDVLTPRLVAHVSTLVALSMTQELGQQRYLGRWV